VCAQHWKSIDLAEFGSNFTFNDGRANNSARLRGPSQRLLLGFMLLSRYTVSNRKRKMVPQLKRQNCMFFVSNVCEKDHCSEQILNKNVKKAVGSWPIQNLYHPKFCSLNSENMFCAKPLRNTEFSIALPAFPEQRCITLRRR